MNPKFKQWLEEQTYYHIWNKTGRWIVINKTYVRYLNFNWDEIMDIVKGKYEPQI
jgi:hypothetical protein